MYYFWKSYKVYFVNGEHDCDEKFIQNLKDNEVNVLDYKKETIAIKNTKINNFDRYIDKHPFVPSNEHEREERMPSDEEINKITDEKGSWSSDEVKYDTYQNVLKKYKSNHSKYFDTVIEIGQYKLGIKEKNILVVYDEDIDYFYSHYLNLIKK